MAVHPTDARRTQWRLNPLKVARDRSQRVQQRETSQPTCSSESPDVEEFDEKNSSSIRWHEFEHHPLSTTPSDDVEIPETFPKSQCGASCNSMEDTCKTRRPSESRPRRVPNVSHGMALETLQKMVNRNVIDELLVRPHSYALELQSVPASRRHEAQFNSVTCTGSWLKENKPLGKNSDQTSNNEQPNSKTGGQAVKHQRFRMHWPFECFESKTPPKVHPSAPSQS